MVGNEDVGIAFVVINQGVVDVSVVMVFTRKHGHAEGVSPCQVDFRNNQKKSILESKS